MKNQAPPLESLPAVTNEAHQWWVFCLFIVSLKFFLLALDPLPKFYMGDSASYIWTALSGWIPPDRSFIYGYVIRWSVWTESLTPLMILQVFVGAGTALVFTSICRSIFLFPLRLSYVFGIFCSIDPLQALWEHYVMTETISLFLYVVMLRYSFLYLRHRRVRDLVLLQALAVALLSFRLSYLILIQVSYGYPTHNGIPATCLRQIARRLKSYFESFAY